MTMTLEERVREMVEANPDAYSLSVNGAFALEIAQAYLASIAQGNLAESMMVRAMSVVHRAVCPKCYTRYGKDAGVVANYLTDPQRRDDCFDPFHAAIRLVEEGQ